MQYLGKIVAKSYILYEAHIVKLFNQCENLVWRGRFFDKVSACKPRSQRVKEGQRNGGEPKTDVYVLLENTKTGLKEIIKISVKKDNAEFFANKLNATVAEDLLGCDWKNILIKNIKLIQERFTQQKITYFKNNRGVKDAFFTLGWKLEIINKSRKLSVPLILSQEEVIQLIYKGINQPDSKRNAVVFGKVEENSGIAEYLLKGDINKHQTVESIIKDLKFLDSYTPENLHLAFTANNYRFKANKADGDRHLAVSINWEVEEGRLKPNFDFNNPLAFTGQKDKMPLIKSCLSELDIKKIEDINFDEIKPL